MTLTDAKHIIVSQYKGKRGAGGMIDPIVPFIMYLNEVFISQEGIMKAAAARMLYEIGSSHINQRPMTDKYLGVKRRGKKAVKEKQNEEE